MIAVLLLLTYIQMYQMNINERRNNDTH